jgi:hypothetical protein
MHLKALVPLFLAGFTFAEQATSAERAAIDNVVGYAGLAAYTNILSGTDIAKLLGDLTSGFNRLDNLIAQISSSNVASTMDKIVAEGSKFNDVLKKNADSLKSGKPISGLGDIIPLISKIGPLLSSLNKTLSHTIEKRPIVLNAKLAGKLKEGLYLAEPGIVSLVLAFPSQISAPAAKTSGTTSKTSGTTSKTSKTSKTSDTASSGGTPAPAFELTESSVKPIVDGVLDFVVGAFDGSVDLSEIGKQLSNLASSAGIDLSKFGGGGKGKKSGTAPATAAAFMTSGKYVEFEA